MRGSTQWKSAIAADERPYLLCRLEHLLLTLVLRARPEKTLEAVPLRARYDMDVQMRDALADDVVHRDECPLRAERLRDRTRDGLNTLEEWTDRFERKVRQRDDVCARNDQHVSNEERRFVEEREREVV